MVARSLAILHTAIYDVWAISSSIADTITSAKQTGGYRCSTSDAFGASYTQAVPLRVEPTLAAAVGVTLK